MNYINMFRSHSQVLSIDFKGLEGFGNVLVRFGIIRSDLDVKKSEMGSAQVPLDMSSFLVRHVQQPFVQKQESLILPEGISTCRVTFYQPNIFYGNGHNFF